MTLDEFAKRLHDDLDFGTIVDRAVALLWFAGREDPTISLSAKEVASTLRRAGYPDQNCTRLDRGLTADRRTAKAGPGRYRLRPASRVALEGQLHELVGPQRAQAPSLVIPAELIHDTRDYLERVVHQINASYSYGLFDCCAVMLRRLVETLIVEVFEARSMIDRIQVNGQFMMLDGLLGALERERATITLGRNTLNGLRELKELGDRSAHNRRFCARQPDIDHVRAGVRTAVEELVALARFREARLWEPGGSATMAKGQALGADRVR